LKKKILIDIYHLPQYNFFRNAIRSLGPENVDLACVDRGKLAPVIQHECPEFDLHILGDYKKNKGPVSMATRIIIPRIRSLMRLIRKNDYRVIGTAHYQANLAGKLLGIPNFSILDDPRAGVMPIVKWSADEFYLPPFDQGYDKIKKLNALKEWAYLSPKYFKPTTEVLREYGLEKKKYFFIREVDTNTSNYLLQKKDIVSSISDLFKGEFEVVLSLENKASRSKYPEDWIILREPVSDIHSLMYHSAMVLSSGDSMAREGAMLGVPAVYLGFRDMPANRILMEEKMLVKQDPEGFVNFLEDWKTGKHKFKGQDEFRQHLDQKWDDVTGLILSLIDKLGKE